MYLHMIIGGKPLEFLTHSPKGSSKVQRLKPKTPPTTPVAHWCCRSSPEVRSLSASLLLAGGVYRGLSGSLPLSRGFR